MQPVRQTHSTLLAILLGVTWSAGAAHGQAFTPSAIIQGHNILSPLPAHAPKSLTAPPTAPVPSSFCNFTLHINQFEKNEIFMQKMQDFSEKYLRNAINPPESIPGAIMASPTRTNPNVPVGQSQDYFFHWKRDAAISMKEIFHLALDAKNSGNPTRMNDFFKLLDDYALFSRKLQLTRNLSSDVDQHGIRNVDGRGVGDPKFTMKGEAFWEQWVRSQNDGPALEARTLILYAKELIAQGKIEKVKAELYDPNHEGGSVIKVNLEVTAKYWTEATGNVWEDKKGDLFFTRLAQWAALREGADLARILGDQFAADHYESVAKKIQTSLDAFFVKEDGYIRSILNQKDGISPGASLDAEFLLAVILSSEIGQPFSVLDDRMMSSMVHFEKSMEPIYEINKITHSATGQKLGSAIGRNQEDKYNGYYSGNQTRGNPWFVTTLAAGEYYYQFLNALNIVGNITVSDLNLEFLNRLGLSHSISPGQTFTKGSAEFSDIVEGSRAKAEGFFNRVKFHSGGEGHLSEQFNRDTGIMQGVDDLTWSYAAFLSFLRAMRESSLISTRISKPN